MEFKTSKPRPPSVVSATPPAYERVAPTARLQKKHLLWAAGAVLATLLIVFCAVIIKQNFFSTEANIQKDRYQALFMANGQLYFGKLSQVEGQYVVMRDVFYLQTQAQGGTPTNVEEAEGQSQVLLTKLGSELQGPEDAMFISREQVLFWENLRTDSKVVKAIEDFKAKK